MIRALLVVLCVVVLLLGLYGMRVGWRHRGERQSGLPPLPEVPAAAGPEAAEALTGLYVGTTFAGSWQDRVVHGGLGRRSSCVATLHRLGVVIERVGDESIFIPRADILDVRLAPALAGKVMGEGGLLVIRWRLGEAELDTGLRADDKNLYPDWVHALSTTPRGPA